ncbi:MAG: cytosine permease, partial [Candidatus Marsarchaeota archaeon]
IDLASVFRRGGNYWYKAGVNVKALAAMLVGATVPFVGYAAGVKFLYDFGWYLSLFISGISYLLLWVLKPQAGNSLHERKRIRT